MNKLLTMYNKVVLLFFTLFTLFLHSQNDDSFKKIKIDDALLKIVSDIGFGVIYNTNYGNFNLSLYSYGYEIVYGLGVSVVF